MRHVHGVVPYERRDGLQSPGDPRGASGRHAGPGAEVQHGVALRIVLLVCGAAGIPFTDVMYELKRLGTQHGLYPKRTPNAVMVKAFMESVDRHGRTHEPELVQKYYLRTNPLKFLSQVSFGLRLLVRGRMAVLAHNIKGVGNLRKMMAAIEENKAT